MSKKPKFDETELSVCENCIQLLANGEINDGEDTAEQTGAGMARIWGDDVKHLVPGGNGDDDLGYCTSSCDGCGNTDHGDRYRATALIPA